MIKILLYGSILKFAQIYVLLVSPDPQLDLRREELHHHLPPPHRHALPVHEQRGGEGGEDRLIIDIGNVSPENGAEKKGFSDFILHSGLCVPRTMTIFMGSVQSPKEDSAFFFESPNIKLSEKRGNY